MIPTFPSLSVCFSLVFLLSLPRTATAIRPLSYVCTDIELAVELVAHVIQSHK